MSTGAIFQLITNDGKTDNLLMATSLLNRRIAEIKYLKSRDRRFRDPNPTLVDIERTHILFVNAHFKPFAAIAYEYQLQRNQSGTVALGGTARFSIAQFGDFIHDMVLHVTIDSVSASQNNDASQFIRYCDFPGQRLLKETAFTVNGNPLDKYSDRVYVFHREYKVQPNKEVGWNRGIGQEEQVRGVVNSCEGRGVGYRQEVSLLNGYQTPKATQPALDLWIPLLFWFNVDPRLSIPSVAIPFGQRFIDFQFASAAELLQHVGNYRSQDDVAANPVTAVPAISKCELFVNNIFVNPEIHDIIIRRIGFNLIRIHLEQKAIIQNPTNDILLNNLKWPIETIYVGLIPSENLSTTNTKMLDGWHKYQSRTLSEAKLCAMTANAWNFGAAALANDPAQAADYTASWQKVDGQGTTVDFAATLGVAGTDVLSVAQINTVLRSAGVKELDSTATFADPANPTNAEVLAAVPDACCVAEYYQDTPTISNLLIRAHGNTLYQQIDDSFYNHYLSYHFGGDRLRTPKDAGKLMVPFNLYPGTYQPSGHINISRSREFYLNFESPNVSSNNPHELHLIGVALNFLLISDGSAILRYST